MARAFSGTAQYLSRTSAVLTGVPITMACWARTSGLAQGNALMSLSQGTGGGNNNAFVLYFGGDIGGDPIRAATTAAGTTSVANSGASGITTNVWFHATAVFAAANNRVAYVNGGNSGSEGTTRTPTAIDSTTIGGYKVTS